MHVAKNVIWKCNLIAVQLSSAIQSLWQFSMPNALKCYIWNTVFQNQQTLGGKPQNLKLKMQQHMHTQKSKNHFSKYMEIYKITSQNQQVHYGNLQYQS